MQEIHDMDVITVTVDVGQGDNQNKIAKKAKKLGVKKHYNIDAKKDRDNKNNVKYLFILVAGMDVCAV